LIDLNQDTNGCKTRRIRRGLACGRAWHALGTNTTGDVSRIDGRIAGSRAGCWKLLPSARNLRGRHVLTTSPHQASHQETVGLWTGTDCKWNDSY